MNPFTATLNNLPAPDYMTNYMPKHVVPETMADYIPEHVVPENMTDYIPEHVVPENMTDYIPEHVVPEPEELTIYIYVTDSIQKDTLFDSIDSKITEYKILAPPDHSDKGFNYHLYGVEPEKVNYTKRYYYDVRQGDMVILSTKTKRINVLTCNKQQLQDFLSTKEENDSIDFYISHLKNIKYRIDSAMLSSLIYLAKTYLSITQATIIERYTEMEDNGFNARVNYIINHTDVSLPESRLAIGIFTHGELNDKKHLNPIDVPAGVIIKKQNVGALGGTTISKPRINLSAFNATLDALKKVDCIDADAYVSRVEKKNKTDPDARLNLSEGTCRLMEGYKRFYNKKYMDPSGNSTIVFLKVKDGRLACLDLFFCTEKGFRDFFSIDTREYLDFTLGDTKKTKRVPAKSVKSNPKRFFLSVIQKFKSISTSEIFNLITLARKTLNVSEVHIYDKSCNVLPLSDKEEGFRGYSTTFQSSISNRIGFGGTRRKRKKTYKKVII